MIKRRMAKRRIMRMVNRKGKAKLIPNRRERTRDVISIMVFTLLEIILRRKNKML